MIALLFLVAFLGFVAFGIPIAFALGATMVVLLLAKGGVTWMVVAQQMLIGADNFPLMAIPFFMLAGELMNEGGMSKRIVRFASALVGHIRGGLSLVSIVSSMMFAGVSGSAVADTAAIGSLMVPPMVEAGYDADFSGAVAAAGGCIGPIIPPSIPMVLYGATAGVSVISLFLGGIVPGFMIGFALMGVAYYIAGKRGYPVGKKATFRELVVSLKETVWALFLPVIILGGILGGIFTPTESAAVATVYAFLVGFFVYRELNLKDLVRILTRAAVSSSVVMFVVATATGLAWTLNIERIPQIAAQLISSLAQSPVAVLLIVNAFLLFAGVVMDLTPNLLILTPVFLPIIKQMGISPIYFGVLMVMNLCIGLITPPVGTILYLACGLTGESLWKMSKAVFPFVLAMIGVLIINILVPETVMFIPGALSP